MDKMKIKSGLAFSKLSGKLVGFCNLGSVNSEMALFITGENSRVPQSLLHICLSSWHDQCSSHHCHLQLQYIQVLALLVKKLFPVVWAVIETLMINFLPVIAVTSDGGSPNWRFYKLCKDRGIDYKTRNPFSPDRYIYFFCDPPHLLKTARNCFSNSFSHSKSRKLEVSSITINCIIPIFLKNTAQGQE